MYKPPQPKTHRRVLLLTSYCDEESETHCTDIRPCNDCLSMCNTFNIKRDGNFNEYAGELGEETV